MNPVPDPIAVPRPASTVILLRDGADGLEILLMRRNAKASFMPEAYVFPGGAVDVSDAAADIRAHCDDCDDAQLNQRLGLDSGGLSWLVAGVRECFEECGLLLARSVSGRDLTTIGLDAATRESWRREILGSTQSLSALCREFQLRLSWNDLHYHSQWVTPPVRSKRFDTRFFVARAPVGQEATLVPGELADLIWITPRAVLDKAKAGELLLVHATRTTIEGLKQFPNSAAALEHTRALTTVPSYRPTGAMTKTPSG